MKRKGLARGPAVCKDVEIKHLQEEKSAHLIAHLAVSSGTFSGYDIPASEIEAGMGLHLPCLVKVGQGHNGYKNIEEFLPEAAE